MKLIGNEAKINFVKEILSNVKEWNYNSFQENITIKFERVSNREVLGAIYQWLGHRTIMMKKDSNDSKNESM